MNDDELRKVDKQGESMVASFRYMDVSNLAYKWLGAMSKMFPVCKAPLPHSSVSVEFLHSTFLRPKKPFGSWIFVSLFQDEWSVYGGPI